MVTFLKISDISNFCRFSFFLFFLASTVAQQSRIHLAMQEMPEIMYLMTGSGRSPGEGNGNPLQYSCLEEPTDRGAWWATVYGVTKSQTRLGLSDWMTTAIFYMFISFFQPMACVGAGDCRAAWDLASCFAPLLSSLPWGLCYFPPRSRTRQKRCCDSPKNRQLGKGCSFPFKLSGSRILSCAVRQLSHCQDAPAWCSKVMVCLGTYSGLLSCLSVTVKIVFLKVVYAICYIYSYMLRSL